LEYVDRVLFMQDGCIVADGTLEELLNTNADFRRFAATIAQQEANSGVVAVESDLAVVGEPRVGG
ncbi:MAG: hypothetical protein NDI61_09395, partial [Bdellovibrionaceae bacterium]|nr:hypothetical protein [Pseudobdellovibrionaceae bacterium]